MKLIQSLRNITILSFFSYGTVVSSLSVQSATSVDPTIQLQTFLDSKDGAARFCEIGQTKYGRGLVATKKLEPGETAIRVPMASVLVEPDNLEEESILEDDCWAGRLANRLIRMTKQNSIYAQTLPLPPSSPVRTEDWPEWLLDEFQNEEFTREISTVQDWRYHQWKAYSGSHEDRQSFLDALDLVCSRTIRCGKDMMLVPLVDMANHASRQEGGGYYKRNKEEETVSLIVGERGILEGEEVTLDYGDRTNEDWLLYYGFLPYRNDAEIVKLPSSKRIVSWLDVQTKDLTLKQECLEFLQKSKTTLEEDLNESRRDGHSTSDDYRYKMALQYRISRKILLSAVAA
mmetsp:Transcript_23106/g.25934  ORF Transcript_23106/g.25934 Transcript_23106/m.25934 type:complete len:345 (+) Transcript_23106:53-1087(+)